MSPSRAELEALAARLVEGGARGLLGLCGGPGAGKSTLAARLAEAFGSRAVVVPMDGFHLANEELARLGRAERKGAPDTFDVFGYRSLLERLRARRPSETVYAPVFQRKIEQAIAGFIPVGPEVELIITEGNYLLLGDGPWAPVATMLDKCWFIEVAEEEQRRRLLERHTGNGRSRDAALAWIEHTDMPNARRIAASRHRAHQIILTGGAPLS